jgi:serine/threonine protein kinase
LADRLTLPQPGDVIAGKYRIDCAIGSGGMGAVFQVTHRVTGKRFALKWLLPQMTAHSDAAHRFIREAQVAGRFEHPSVVEVYDVGSEGDSFYMVMELLEGESLAERVDRAGPLSVTEACELLIPCMRGVAEAHGAGIVHRDLKPANIFICRADRHARECAKVLDFGISKMSGAPGGELGEGMTKSGTLIGTPHYMPLEQMRGRAVDHRADIYALGVVLYQVLSGNLPYPADSFSDLVLMLAHETPLPLEKVVPRLPRGLAQVIARAMAREAADRYQSIDDLIAALEPYASGRDSVPAYTPSGRRSLDSSLSLPTPLSTESRVSGRVSAHSMPPPSRAPWIVGVSAFVILVALAAGALWLRRDRGQAEVAGPGVVRPSVAPASAAAPPAALPGAVAAGRDDTQPGTSAAARPRAAEEVLPALNIVSTAPERGAAPGSVVAEQAVEGGVPQPEQGVAAAQPEPTAANRGNAAAAMQGESPAANSGDASGAATRGNASPAATRGNAPAATRGGAAARASAPAAARAAAAAARVAEARAQSQRAEPPAPELPELPELPVKNQAAPAREERDTRSRPTSSRVPAISEGDFY